MSGTLCHDAAVFEWHGWAVVVASPAVEGDEPGDLRSAQALDAVERYLSEQTVVHNEVLGWRTHNDQLQVWMAGCHNHPTTTPFEVLERVGQLAPGSYGVMHSIDHDRDRDWARRVLRRGAVEAEVEHSLSPHIGVIEDADSGGR